MNNCIYSIIIVILLLCYLSGCGNAQDSDQLSLSFSEEERKTPSIGTNGRLVAGEGDSVLFCDAQGGIYETRDGGENWDKFGKSRQMGNSQIVHPALSLKGDFAYAAMTQTAGYEVCCPDSQKGMQPCIRIEGHITAMTFGKDGMLYVAEEYDGGSSISAVDSVTGEDIFVTEAASTVYHLAVSEELLYLRERSRIEIYDLSTGEMQKEDKVLNAFAGRYTENSDTTEAGEGLYLLPEGDALYLGCEDGLFYYLPGEKKATKLVDGAMSYFGKFGVKLLGLTKLDDNIYLALFSDGKLRYFNCNMEGKMADKRVLKVFSLHKYDSVRKAIEEFKAENPDVAVEYEYGMMEESSMTEQDVMKNLNAELMSGNGPDVILMDGMNAEVYVRKGMLLDLSQVLDEIAKEEGLLENVAYSQRREDGAVYVIPTRFWVPVLAGKNSDIEGVDSLADLADLVVAIRERMPEGPILETYGAGETLELLALTSAHSWVKDGVLQEEKVREFLIQAKRMYDAEIAGVDEEKRQEILDSMQIYEGKEIIDWTQDISFKEYLTGNDKGLLVGAIREMHGIGGLATYLGAREVMAMKGMPGQSSNILVPKVLVSVSSRTCELKLAEGFVKTMLGKKSQRYFTMEGLAVNRESFESMADEVESHWLYFSHDEEGNFVDWGGAGYPSEQKMILFKEIVSSGKCILSPDQQIQDVIRDYGEKVLVDKISLEEGMQQIHRNIFVYLAE